LRLLIFYTKGRGKNLLGAFGKVEKLGIATLEKAKSDQQPDTLETGFGFLGTIVPKLAGKIRGGLSTLSLEKLKNQKIAVCQL